MRSLMEAEETKDTEILMLVRELISDIFMLTSESSYKDPGTARELRKASVNAVYAIMNGCKRVLRSSIEREFCRAGRFLNDMKWYMCVTLENGYVSRDLFFEYIRKIRFVENSLLTSSVPKKLFQNFG